MELEWGGLEICRVQGETYPKSHSPSLRSWRSQVNPEDLTRASTVVLFFPWWVFPTGFSHARFLTRQQVQHKWGLWCTLFSYLFSHWVFEGVFNEAYTWHVIGQGGVLWIMFNVAN
jgi:hypothetical protein